MMEEKKTFIISTYPAAILRKKTRFISNISEEIRGIIKKMSATMKNNKGIGLAAPQVGLDIQLAVVDTGEGLIKLINPIILKREGIDVMEEGCLSIPQTIVTVKRAKKITVQYSNDKKERVTKTYEGMTAKAIQHEMDHLNGVLIIDYLPWYKRILTRE